MENRRTEIICPKCGATMEFTKKITPPVDGLAGLIFRCPTRNDEGGCGNIKEVLVDLSPKGQELFV